MQDLPDTKEGLEAELAQVNADLGDCDRKILDEQDKLNRWKVNN